MMRIIFNVDSADITRDLPLRKIISQVQGNMRLANMMVFQKNVIFQAELLSSKSLIVKLTLWMKVKDTQHKGQKKLINVQTAVWIKHISKLISEIGNFKMRLKVGDTGIHRPMQNIVLGTQIPYSKPHEKKLTLKQEIYLYTIPNRRRWREKHSLESRYERNQSPVHVKGSQHI